MLQSNLQQALPAALQQAGINLALVQGYIPAVLAALVPALAQKQIGSRRQVGASMFLSESSPLAAQIMGSDPNGFTVAARPTPQPMRTAMNPVAPQQFQPAPAQYVQPQQVQPMQPMAPQASKPPIAPPNFAQPAPVLAGDPPTLLE